MRKWTGHSVQDLFTFIQNRPEKGQALSAATSTTSTSEETNERLTEKHFILLKGKSLQWLILNQFFPSLTNNHVEEEV